MSGPDRRRMEHGRYETENEARQALIATARAMNAAAINIGQSGNLSLRWARSGGPGFLITPSALPYDRLEVDDVCWVRLDAPAGAGDGLRPPPTLWDGQRPPSSEWRLHRDILASRPEFGSVLHAHGPESAALACSARVQRDGIPAFHYMLAVAGGKDLRCAPYEVFGSQALSDRALIALAGRRACLLANHGLLAAGAGLDQALALAIDVEGLCGQYRRLLQLGDPVLLDEAQMDQVLRRFGDYAAGS